MDAGEPGRQPIGYWLKRADELITQLAERALQSRGLTRPHWQLLNSVAQDGPLASITLQARLRPFVDAAGFQRLVADLARRGWLSEAAAKGRLELTEAGRRAHGEAAASMGLVRQASARGMSREDYEQLLRGLQLLCSNLEAALAAQQHERAL